MHKRTLFLVCGVALCCGATFAGSVFSLDPIDGQLSAGPNSTVGWGFVVTSDPLNWISFTGSALENLSAPTIGDYTDFIGTQGGPVNAVLAPGAPAWVQSFDAGLEHGVGAFLVAPPPVPAPFESGDIVIFYDVFSDDPNTCGSCQSGSGSFTAPFQINETDAATPEPATAAVAGLALLALCGWKRRAPHPSVRCTVATRSLSEYGFRMNRSTSCRSDAAAKSAV